MVSEPHGRRDAGCTGSEHEARPVNAGSRHGDREGRSGRRLLAEFVGTALIVIFGAGALVAALEMGQGQLDYAGLGDRRDLVRAGDRRRGLHVRHDLGRPHQPGGHVLARRGAAVSLGRGGPLLGRAARGALVGALLINAIFGSQASDLNVSGGTVVGAGFTKAQAAVAEGLGTFLLLATIMALAVDRRAPTGFAGLVIGLAVACEIMVIGPISGGSVNPARTFGPYLATSIFGGSTPWSEFWIYWAGPLVGGAIAALAYDRIAQPERAAAASAAGRGHGRHRRGSSRPPSGRQGAAEPASYNRKETT